MYGRTPQDWLLYQPTSSDSSIPLQGRTVYNTLANTVNLHSSQLLTISADLSRLVALNVGHLVNSHHTLHRLVEQNSRTLQSYLAHTCPAQAPTQPTSKPPSTTTSTISPPSTQPSPPLSSISTTRTADNQFFTIPIVATTITHPEMNQIHP
mmetsp:Transcript_13139/g.19675  ORF Transcript_13139/g.19675 Transcript_13139/m.19675 type:complete len:152 (+) Transcript_13139:608-1063(+)